MFLSKTKNSGKILKKMKKSEKFRFFEKILNFGGPISSFTSDRNEFLRRPKDAECAKPSSKIVHSENDCQSFEQWSKRTRKKQKCHFLGPMPTGRPPSPYYVETGGKPST